MRQGLNSTRMSRQRHDASLSQYSSTTSSFCQDLVLGPLLFEKIICAHSRQFMPVLQRKLGLEDCPKSHVGRSAANPP